MEIFEKAEIERNQNIANEQLYRLYDRNNKGYIDSDDLKYAGDVAGIFLDEQ